MNAEFFTPTDADGIPTGEIRSVAGTGLDFRSPKTIGKDIDSTEPDIAERGGFDHNFVIAKRTDEMAVAAEVWEPESGRVLTVRTTEPGVQFYTGNFLTGTFAGTSGRERRLSLRASQRLLPGDAAFSGLAQYRAFSQCHFAAGAAFPIEDELYVFDALRTGVSQTKKRQKNRDFFAASI